MKAKSRAKIWSTRTERDLTYKKSSYRISANNKRDEREDEGIFFIDEINEEYNEEKREKQEDKLDKDKAWIEHRRVTKYPGKNNTIYIKI